MEEKVNVPIDLSLYNDLAKIVEGFESPEDVIRRLLTFYVKNSSQIPAAMPSKIPVVEPVRSFQLDVVFCPADEGEFKRLLVEKKLAWVKLFMVDGTTETKKWRANSFTNKSDVMGNLRSGYLRHWREKGICKAEIVINPSDLSS